MNNDIVLSSINSVINYNRRYCLQLDNTVYTELMNKIKNRIELSTDDIDLVLHCLKLSVNMLKK